MTQSKFSFRSLDLAIQFHDSCQGLALPGYLKNQLLRASSSVALNLAEGYGKFTPRDRLRFFHIAMGSVRECQTALRLAPKKDAAVMQTADHLGACIYKLCQTQQRQ